VRGELIKKASSEICVMFPSLKGVRVVCQSLKSEIGTQLTSRSKTKIEYNEKNIVLSIEAKDTTALRASINSYLNWFILLRDVLRCLIKYEGQSTPAY
jgi:KEOPS complex subunit Pcc1